MLSAMAAQLVAQLTRKAEAETVFVGGLMQNIGQLVLARSHPELFQQVLTVSAEEGLPYHVVEQELLGFDHGDLGALLIKEWNLSEDLEQAVRWHHRLDHPEIACRDLAALVEETIDLDGGEEEFSLGGDDFSGLDDDVLVGVDESEDLVTKVHGGVRASQAQGKIETRFTVRMEIN